MALNHYTMDGWYTAHDFRLVQWAKLAKLSSVERSEIIAELEAFSKRWDTAEDPKCGSFGCFEMLGNRADLLMVTLRPTVDELLEFKRDFAGTRFFEFTEPGYSYLSVVELSNYVNDGDQEAAMQVPAVQNRLKPQLPNTKHICFYPMNKKRDGADNWYMLPIEARRELMKSHGMVGRKYAGKITQIIGGSIGFDDWEWGVMLFSDDPLEFKHIVYEMRFDEVSARFGEFGPFYVGSRLTSFHNWITGVCRS